MTGVLLRTLNEGAAGNGDPTEALHTCESWICKENRKPSARRGRSLARMKNGIEPIIQWIALSPRTGSGGLLFNRKGLLNCFID